MKFIIKYDNKVEQRLLTYISKECSFDMYPIVSKVDLELIVNKLCLSIIDNRIIQLWGFCGLNIAKKSNFDVPEFQKGSLLVEHNLNLGFSYRINDEDLPVYVNLRTGWVCIGVPEKKGNAVEFINNCIAVIGDNNEFLSLWLKPQSLPDL